MDADFKEKRRARISSQREKRWSMNSQRLEEIVGELMRPIGDLRHSFDTDLSALLEEYLTEAGLHALAAEEDEDLESAPAPAVGPNFAELALLLQQSANIYGRKVDFLYQHVIAVSEALQDTSLEIVNSTPESTDPSGQSPRARGRLRAPEPSAFSAIALEKQVSAAREPTPRQPPVLPRVYLELEPRLLAESEPQLTDYEGEPIGVLADYHVAWRIHNGMLVEELEQSTAASCLRDIPVIQLQEALAARAPSPPPPPAPSPPPRCCSPPLPASPSPCPLLCSTPLPPCPASPCPCPMPPPPTASCKRKRKIDKVQDTTPPPDNIKLHISKELRRSLSECKEFSLPWSWVKRELARRREAVTSMRELLREQQDQFTSFNGWSPSPRAPPAPPAPRADSDDDGFFEQSSLADSDHSPHCDHTNTATTMLSLSNISEPSTGVDIRAECSRVLSCLAEGEGEGQARGEGEGGGDVTPFSKVLALAGSNKDVSRLLLATLFLANSGNVEICQSKPLCVESFSVRLVSQSQTLLDACDELS